MGDVSKSIQAIRRYLTSVLDDPKESAAHKFRAVELLLQLPRAEEWAE